MFIYICLVLTLYLSHPTKCEIILRKTVNSIMSRDSHYIDIESETSRGSGTGNGNRISENQIVSDGDSGLGYSVRSPLARAVYGRLIHQRKHMYSDHGYWYTVKKNLLSDNVKAKFIQSKKDEETKKFMENCFEKSDWLFTQIWQNVVKSVLTFFISSTSVNGLLGRGSMFVLSSKQFETLLRVDEHWKTDKLLDLGAGDGVVTVKMASHFKEIYVTEVSRPMIWRLQYRGYRVLGLDDWHSSQKYDVIAALNLLDRCSKPITLLKNIRQSLNPNGFAVIAVVLPFHPFVESGAKDNQPEEEIPLRGRTLEEQANSFVKDLFEPLNFTLHSFTRLPYLCEGDLQQSFYELEDAVFVLKPV